MTAESKTPEQLIEFYTGLRDNAQFIAGLKLDAGWIEDVAFHNAALQSFADLRAAQETIARLEGVERENAGLKAELNLAGQMVAAQTALSADAARLDWLEQHTVNVRKPLRYGSRDLFWSAPEMQEGDEDAPSNIRAAIDAAREPK